LHDCRVATDGHIAAVVDWEISTVGYPLADLDGGVLTPTTLPGFCDRQFLIDRYPHQTAADVDSFPGRIDRSLRLAAETADRLPA
jgi:aminoglycoside phosphotransferase (APT) family kinase protein